MGRQLKIIWPFLVTVPLLLILAIASLAILAAGRAYVEGESLWSKGQKASIYHLLRYVQTRDEADYKRHVEALAVPLGDRISRLELEKPTFDYEVARQGYLRGRNHPDDIPGMITLFRLFRNEPHIDRVITLWTNGDRHIAAIESIAKAIHQQISSGQIDQYRTRELIDNLHEVNASLTPLTDEFSRTLGDATRWTQRTLILVMFFLTVTLLSASVVISRRIIRRHEQVEAALRNSEERFQLAVSGSNDGIWDWDLEKNATYYSPRLKQLLGFSEHELPSTFNDLLSRVHPDDRDSTMSTLSEHLDNETPYDIEFRIRTKSGEYRWVRSRGQSVRNSLGKAVRMAGSISDITDRKLAETQLFAEKERAQVTLESIGDAVITTDVTGCVQYMNPIAETLIGSTLSVAHGKPWSTLVGLLDEETRLSTPDLIESVLRIGQSVELSGNIILVRPDGAEVAIDQSAAPIRDRAGNVSGVVLVLHDMSRERQYATKLSYLASHDALTGLINRREFEIRLQGAIESARERDRHHGVMFLDLDQFKVVNDTSGHAAGDEMLRQVSKVLQRRLREGDTLARLGGDEFGVLLENCPAHHAARIAEEIRESLLDYRFIWHSRSFSIGVSVGLVNISGDALRLEDLMSAADSACYVAKEKGRNRVQIYHPNDTELSRRQGEMEWVERIHRALDEDRFTIYAQRIVNLLDASTGGQHVELLIRLRDEARHIIPPMAFIPAAERYGLMPLIDQWVLRTALTTLAARHALGDYSIETCSINLSGASIGDERFLDYVREQFATCPVPYQIICFEITETAAISNLAKAERFMHALRDLGCRFSLDDFGAGMSSFTYLKQLPVDFLKIDGSFVKDMVGDPINRAMVEAINHIGHVMGKTTIAEFVENEQILNELRQIGVDYAQGFGVHRPEPFENWPIKGPRRTAVTSLVSERSARPRIRPRLTQRH